tara:strand:+ start:554 stop:721 length:168 start_codon:yes stop_codon:yes gene_type:complete
MSKNDKKIKKNTKKMIKKLKKTIKDTLFLKKGIKITLILILSCFLIKKSGNKILF